MKKLLAFLLAVLIVSTAVYPAFATEDQNQQQYSPILRGLMASDTSKDMNSLITRSNYGYMQFAANFRASGSSQYAIHMAGNLIDTGYEPDEAKYIEVLSNIILTYDFSNAADISNQAQLDDLKGFKDYMMDVKNAAVDIVGLLSVNSEFEEALTIAIDEMSVLIDSTDNWLKALYDLDTVLQNYSFYDFFLEAVEENSDGALKSAASKMKNSLSTILEIRLEAYADVSIDNLKEFGEFFFSDIFIDYAKNTSEYQNDVSIRFITDVADALVVLSASWDLGKLIGKTIGNVVVGGEDLINRVLEIEALYDISCTLPNKLSNTRLEALEECSDEKAEQCVRLAQVLIDCRIRGEYCEYSVLASDAGLLSWAGKDSAEEALEWYESQTTALLAMENRFVAILNMGIITGTVYTTESGGTPTALMNAMVIVEDTDGDAARAEIMTDSNEYSYLLPAGTYTITVELDGYETARKEVTLAENDVLDVDFEMEVSLACSGLVENLNPEISTNQRLQEKANELAETYGFVSHEPFVTLSGTKWYEYPVSIQGIISYNEVDLDLDDENELVVLRILPNFDISAELYKVEGETVIQTSHQKISQIEGLEQKNITLFYSPVLEQFCFFIDTCIDGSYTGSTELRGTIYTVSDLTITFYDSWTWNNMVWDDVDIEAKLNAIGVPYAEYCASIDHRSEQGNYSDMCYIDHTVIDNGNDSNIWYENCDHMLQILPLEW